jgi:hypothetical protein
MAQPSGESLQAGKLVGAEMPGEDVQELLIHRVTAASIQQMKGKITAFLAVLGLVAGILGVQGYLKVEELKKKFAAVSATADSLHERLHAADVAIASARELQDNIQSVNRVQQTGYQNLLGNYQATVAGATQNAFEALSRVEESHKDVNRLVQDAGQQLSTVNGLVRQVQDAQSGARLAASQVDSLSVAFRSTLANTIYSVWTVVLDEGKDWVDVGDGFEGKAVSIRNGSRVDLMIRRRGSHEALCEALIRDMAIGDAKSCPFGRVEYRLTLVLAMKQGGINPWHYRDRAQIQLARVRDTSRIAGDLEGGAAPGANGRSIVTVSERP